jgi:hypothetical protein
MPWQLTALPPVTFPVTVSKDAELCCIPCPDDDPPVTFPVRLNVPVPDVVIGVTVFAVTFATMAFPASHVNVPFAVPPVAMLVIVVHVTGTLIDIPVLPFATSTSDAPRLAHVSQEPEPLAAEFHWLTESILTLLF